MPEKRVKKRVKKRIKKRVFFIDHVRNIDHIYLL